MSALASETFIVVNAVYSAWKDTGSTKMQVGLNLNHLIQSAKSPRMWMYARETHAQHVKENLERLPLTKIVFTITRGTAETFVPPFFDGSKGEFPFKMDGELLFTLSVLEEAERLTAVLS